MSPFKREHDWPEDADPPVPYPIRCQVCGFRLPSGDDPLPLCPGDPDERSGLQRKQRLRDVSPDKDRKRSSSVTGETLVFGPICDWARGRDCWFADRADHSCEFYPGRRYVEPAHVMSRGGGGRDWRFAVIDGDQRLVSNVVPLCPLLHDLLDGDVGGGGREDFERRFDCDLDEICLVIAEESGVEPPEHYKLIRDDEIFT